MNVVDFNLICPDCGGSILHECGAIVGANQAQFLTQSGSNGQIAQGSKVLDLDVSPKTNKPYNQGYNAQFLEFWQAYPLKRSKRKAQMAWLKSIKRAGANPAEAMAQILAGAIRYRDDPNRVDEFTKYAEGWLNGDGWEDEPLPSRRPRREVESTLDRMAREAMEGMNAEQRSESPGVDAPRSLPG